MEKLTFKSIRDLQNYIALDVDSILETNEDGGLPHLIFLSWCIDELAELDEAENLMLSNHVEKGAAVHGFSYSEYDGKLDLFITDYKRASEDDTIAPKEAETILKRVYTFAEKYVKAKSNSLNIEDEAYDLVEIMRLSEINLIRFFLFTDRSCRIEQSPDIEINDIPAQTHIWDIKRFLRVKSEDDFQDDTDIEIKDYGYPHLACSSTYQKDTDIETYLCIIPGNLLADIYMNFTTRLIERNVRSFLSFKSKINQGILKTIQNEPNKFIAYNNGLTATATKIDINKEQNKITKIYGLQIVNGGQTTNAIFRAKHANKDNVDEVSVPLKLCVLNEDIIDEIGPNISRFANTQNAVRRTDFSSNNPVFRQLEQISRKVLAPPKQGYHVSTQWFFERTRGQYTDQLSMHKTPAQKKKFQNQFPTKQKIDKGQLSKCWGIWYQDVERVSHGPETYSQAFLEDLESNRTKFDSKNPEQSFQRFVAMKIIFDTTRSIIMKEKYGTIGLGHVTDYTIALISNLCSMQLDLHEIWKNQEVPEEFIENIHIVAPVVGDTLSDICTSNGFQARSVARGNNKIKGQSFWDVLKDKNLKIIPFNKPPGPNPLPPPGPTPTISTEQEEALKRSESIHGEVFLAISAWGKETDNLEPWQRSICYSVGRTKSNNKPISGKQAIHAMAAYDEAKNKGFQEISDD